MILPYENIVHIPEYLQSNTFDENLQTVLGDDMYSDVTDLYHELKTTTRKNTPDKSLLSKLKKMILPPNKKNISVKDYKKMYDKYFQETYDLYELLHAIRFYLCEKYNIYLFIINTNMTFIEGYVEACDQSGFEFERLNTYFNKYNIDDFDKILILDIKGKHFKYAHSKWTKSDKNRKKNKTKKQFHKNNPDIVERYKKTEGPYARNYNPYKLYEDDDTISFYDDEVPEPKPEVSYFMQYATDDTSDVIPGQRHFHAHNPFKKQPKFKIDIADYDSDDSDYDSDDSD